MLLLWVSSHCSREGESRRSTRPLNLKYDKSQREQKMAPWPFANCIPAWHRWSLTGRKAATYSSLTLTKMRQGFWHMRVCWRFLGVVMLWRWSNHPPAPSLRPRPYLVDERRGSTPLISELNIYLHSLLLNTYFLRTCPWRRGPLAIVWETQPVRVVGHQWVRSSSFAL
jgi:hypothetical protein